MSSATSLYIPSFASSFKTLAKENQNILSHLDLLLFSQANSIAKIDFLTFFVLNILLCNRLYFPMVYLIYSLPWSYGTDGETIKEE